MSNKADPLKTIQKLIQERYSDAKAIFWAGSVSQGQGTSASDLDLVIVFDAIPNAYREAFIYDGWPIDAFIHDPDTLRFFFEESRAGNGISGLSYMILNGREILAPNDFSKSIKLLAQELLKSGPAIWDKETIDKERFLITDVLDDIKFPVSRDEQIASAAWLLEALGQFYFRAQNKWCASGKSIIRYLKNDSPALALEFNQCFEDLFQKGDVVGLESVVKKILMPYGGLFWDGFKLNAPKKWREQAISFNQTQVLEELKAREPIFHHPDKFGKTKQDILDMTCDEFWEVGASGNRYSREYVIEVLLDRYSDPEYKDIWKTKDFKCQEIVHDNYLLTYTLLQGKRETKRSTIWRRTSSGWKILYHQGTVVQEAGDEDKK